MTRVGRLPTNIPSFKSFILSGEVKSLYRRVCRATRPIEDDRKAEIRNWVKTEIRNMKHLTDQQQIRMILSQAKRQVEQLEQMVERR